MAQSDGVSGVEGMARVAGTSVLARYCLAGVAVALLIGTAVAVFLTGDGLSSFLTDEALERLVVSRRNAIVRNDATMRALAEARYWYVQGSVDMQRERILGRFAGLLGSTPTIGSGDRGPLVLFYDYNCAPCRAFDSRLRAVVQGKRFSVRYVFIAPRGSAEEIAAVAAILSQKNGRFAEFHRYLSAAPGMAREAVYAAAASAGVTARALDHGLDDPVIADQLAQSRSLAEELGVTGTPALLVGNGLSTGAISTSEIEQRLQKISGVASN